MGQVRHQIRCSLARLLDQVQTTSQDDRIATPCAIPDASQRTSERSHSRPADTCRSNAWRKVGQRCVHQQIRATRASRCVLLSSPDVGAELFDGSGKQHLEHHVRSNVSHLVLFDAGPRLASWPGKEVTVWERRDRDCVALHNRSGDSWLDGKMW